MLSTEDIDSILSLICDRQREMLSKDITVYKSSEYIDLERLKVKIRDIRQRRCKDER